MEKCLCELAGWCPHLGREMTPAMHEDCQKNPTFRAFLADLATGNVPPMPSAGCAGPPPQSPAQAAPQAAPLVQAARPRREQPCQHQGAETGETKQCGTCPGSVKVKVFGCALHGGCTLRKHVATLHCCATCQDYAPLSQAPAAV